MLQNLKLRASEEGIQRGFRFNLVKRFELNYTDTRKNVVC